MSLETKTKSQLAKLASSNKDSREWMAESHVPTSKRSKKFYIGAIIYGMCRKTKPFNQCSSMGRRHRGVPPPIRMF
jgi:hypothetical protein